MQAGEADHPTSGGSRGGHRCGQCEENQAVLGKYKKLVDLLYKKIRQLQKKSNIRLPEDDSRKEPHLMASQQTALSESRQEPANAARQAEALEGQREAEECQMGATRESLRGCPPLRVSKSEVGEVEKLEKAGVVINGLTEEVMQLKSNFMHIRHCVYAFVRELNIGERVRAAPTLLNITLALISIFQFSENEKEEMFNHQKVKIRKRQKGRNKENVFVTIKEI